MEIPVALVVFGLLLAISLYGLSVSSRRAAMNDASRRAMAGPMTVTPDQQRSRINLGPDSALDRRID